MRLMFGVSFSYSLVLLLLVLLHLNNGGNDDIGKNAMVI